MPVEAIEKKVTEAAPKKGKAKTPIIEESVKAPPTVHKLYTLKFNSPILPFAKFPLT